jgi:hypothetical protein
MSTVYIDGQWWAEAEIDGTTISASGKTEAEAIKNLRAKIARIRK